MTKVLAIIGLGAARTFLPKQSLVAVILIASFATTAAATPLQDAGLAYARGDYVTALGIWKPLAEQGDAIAEKSLGRMYDTGRGVQQNSVEAAFWYRKAADQGNAFSQLMLGLMSYNGIGVAKDYGETMKWLRQIADDLPTAESVDKGNTVARYMIGMMYLNGQGVPQDYNEAAKWLTAVARYAEDGNPNDLERLYHAEYGIVQQDIAEIGTWYRKTVREDSFVAAKVLGLIYVQGRGVQQNYQTAMTMFKRAAEAGDALSQYNLGLIYDGGPPNLRIKSFAYFYFDLAAAQGFTGADQNRNRIAPLMNQVEKQTADSYRDTWRLTHPAR